MDKDECDDFANGFSEDVLVHFPPNKVLAVSCIYATVGLHIYEQKTKSCMFFFLSVQLVC